MKKFLLAVVLLVIPLAVAAQESSIAVHDVVARPSLAGAPNGIAFMVIENHGATPDKLIGASSPVSARAQVHEMTMTGNVMRMRAVPSLVIPPNGKVALDPDDYHLMLTGMKQRLKIGDTFPITLKFEKAGEITVTATVAAGD